VLYAQRKNRFCSANHGQVFSGVRYVPRNSTPRNLKRGVPTKHPPHPQNPGVGIYRGGTESNRLLSLITWGFPGRGARLGRGDTGERNDWASGAGKVTNGGTGKRGHGYFLKDNGGPSKKKKRGLQSSEKLKRKPGMVKKCWWEGFAKNWQG